MILGEFNAGWGDQLELRQFEMRVRDIYLRHIAQDDVRTVIINSTWYDTHYHQKVLSELAQLDPQRVIVMAMLDPAIPDLGSYGDRDVWGMGYYAGVHEIDVWAMVVQKYFLANASYDASSIDQPFLCLNRKPHWHRRRLYQQLEHLDLLDRGIVTLGDTDGRPIRALPEDVAGSTLAPNAGPEVYGIVNDIMTLGPQQIWDRCFLNVVTETVFDIERQWFVSEKIYKPVVGFRPFLVYASDGGESWLAHIGLESYCQDFRDISDADPADPDQLVQLLQDLSAQPVSYLGHKYLALSEKIQHNKCMFDLHVHRTWNKVNQGAICPI